MARYPGSDSSTAQRFEQLGQEIGLPEHEDWHVDGEGEDLPDDEINALLNGRR